MLKITIHQSDEMGDVYTLLRPIAIPEKGITVPPGFKSDGASVPRFFWRVVFPPGDPRALRAALVHDWLYRSHPDGWTKAQADDLFYELMIEDGVPRLQARLAYLGVALFGGKAWSENE